MRKEKIQMRSITEQDKYSACPQCDPAAVVQGPNYRFTVLTPQLIRLEYSPCGTFEDRATQTVLNRKFHVPPFHVNDSADQMEIITQSLRISYDKKAFSPNGLKICVGGAVSNFTSVWHYGDRFHTLGGTARTLDATDGAIPLGEGLMSRDGFSVMDDSGSMVQTGDGWVEPRSGDGVDLYFLGYGHDYRKCLKDFYRLCGKTPLLPRYALGNWWSRFHRYTEEEYKGLMERFQKEKIPFSVAVIDMDWHLTDSVDPKYGSPWTGYTWNRKLFPDPPEFLAWLHGKNLKVTLNIHPAEGIRAFEAVYPAMAKAMGVDAAAEEQVEFDSADPKFMDAFFRNVNHPMEKEGVDFWWVDWQQGTLSRIPGLDPLWILNHCYSRDCARQGKRPFILSRFAGVGSHRYPVGFSGDTYITWETLDFQPYFTATASNVGYGWWSHDIGGHMLGYRDDELAVRWLQFGVFSPVCRLHSSASPFNSKEPWQYNPLAGSVMKEFLRLRHAMIPYLYSMNRRASRDGEPLMEPMYYSDPETQEAYQVRNEYWFGSELIVCPITQPMEKTTQAAGVTAWLPRGLWIDFFTGRVYSGGRVLELWRGIGQIPVLAKAGGIVPMADLSVFTNSTENPAALEIRTFAGADGSFTLWEDSGGTPEDLDENWAATRLVLDWQNRKFTISPASGNCAVLPKKRSWKLRFVGFAECRAAVSIHGCPVPAETEYQTESHTLTVSLPPMNIGDEISVFFEKTEIAGNSPTQECFRFLQKAQTEFELKERIYQAAQSLKAPAALAEMTAMHVPQPLFRAVCEILTAWTADEAENK
jgi:hypothetical protein